MSSSEVTVTLESQAFISGLGNHINLISSFKLKTKQKNQITLPPEDTTIFIGQMEWTGYVPVLLQALASLLSGISQGLFLQPGTRSLRSCSPWDVGADAPSSG